MGDTDRECSELLAWALPLVGLDWRGFRNVRRQVCRRVAARMSKLGLDARSYRDRLLVSEAERRAFAMLCFVTISRFYRDAPVFDALRDRLAPLASSLSSRGRDDRFLRVWSAGCASGEEPYTVSILWQIELATRYPTLELSVCAMDFDDAVLARARAGAYVQSSLRELPRPLREAAFDRRDDTYVVREPFRAPITFVRADLRTHAPEAPLHLVLCRNVAFTYFDEAEQRRLIERIRERLVVGGLLVVGHGEALPAGTSSFDQDADCPLIYTKSS